ncbi:MAG: lipase [Planctomycetota bacterium]
MSQACVFGEFDNLVGVFQPSTKSSEHSELAVLILTPGMLHSAGPFRLHTMLADELSNAGLASLRFDLSGIGESLAVGAPGSSLERAASEIRQAIDYLESEHGVRRVICFGLCSGADDAVFAALHEPRIVGVFALDGCGFRTWKFHWHRLWVRYIPKLLSLSKWFEKLSKTLGMNSSPPPSLQLATDIREFPRQAAAENQLIQLAQRGVHLHFHYTGGVDDYYNYADQFSDMFPRLVAERADLASWSYQPTSDHVGFLCEQRGEIVDRVKTSVVAMASSLAVNASSLASECKSPAEPSESDADESLVAPLPDETESQNAPICPAVFPPVGPTGGIPSGSQS